MTRRYEIWKQKIIGEAVSEHRSALPDVHTLNDESLLKLYDQILGVLTGPKTIRMRQSPSLLDCWKLRNAQKSFGRALYHEKKIRELSNHTQKK